MFKIISLNVPRKELRITGYVSVLIGITLFFIRFYFGIKPEFLYLKVFAIYSSYLEEKYFELITNNILDEIIGILLSLGSYLVIITNDLFEDLKNEFSKSFLIAITLNTIMIIISFLFFYGLAFVYMMIVNLFSFNIIFILIAESKKLRIFKD
ncbi:MAG: hypothetical protein N2043_02940 [Ignavibacterium sp.]|nr:hypothetical protein [Ignavibacterium sp.]